MPLSHDTQYSPELQLEARDEYAVVSGDRHRYAVLLVHADVQSDCNVAEIFAGTLPSRFASVAAPIRVARFTSASKSRGRGTFGAADLTRPYGGTWLKWTPDNHTLIFRWSDERDVLQAFAIDTATNEVRQLTHSATDVKDAAVGPTGAIVYTASVAPSVDSSSEMERKGFAVENVSAARLLWGYFDESHQQDAHERFLLRPSDSTPRRVVPNGRGPDLMAPTTEPVFSPKGDFVVLDGTPAQVPREWLEYKPSVDYVTTAIRDALSNPSETLAHELKQMFLVDVRSGRAQPLLQALGGIPAPRAIWSPTARSVLLVSTFLPPELHDPDGESGSAVVEVDINKGDWAKLPLTADPLGGVVRSVRWIDDREIEIATPDGQLYFRKRWNRWRLARRSAEAPDVLPVGVQVRQSMNDWPALYAIDRRTLNTKLLLDPNAALRPRVDLGKVEIVRWKDPENRAWSGRLYYPVGYVSGRRYPLVLQTHGHEPAEVFSLYGSMGFLGLGPGPSVFPGQLLAVRGIAVLHVQDKDVPGVTDSPAEGPMYASAFESAVAFLEAQGLIDSARVGLVGFSRSGYYVEYALTHSGLPYASALESDNLDGGYLQAMMNFGAWSNSDSALHGAAPFGAGLQQWLTTAPPFLADRIHTPLRMQRESSLVGVLGSWETYSRLRILHRPVELYVVPDVEHGGHGVQNPGQLLSSLQGTVDWFDFWLYGREDPDAYKAGQYRRWEKLCDLQVANNPDRPSFCVRTNTH